MYSHLTPRYVINRSLQLLWMKSHPNMPWLSRQAINLFDQLILPSDTGLEFGSGRSTIYFAKKLKFLYTVEHNLNWIESLQASLSSSSLSNVELRTVPNDSTSINHPLDYSQKIISDIPSSSIDFVLVDGVYRDRCALTAVDKLKPGGFMIIDDAHRYLPSSSRSPSALSLNQDCKTDLWSQFLDIVHDWRRIWVSDGIYNDIFFFKP